MPRSRARLHLADGRRIRRQASARRVEGELEYLVGAQTGHEHETIGCIDPDGVRVAPDRDDLPRFADRARTDEVTAVRRTKKGPASLIERDIRAAFRQRRGADGLEGPALPLYREGVHRKRLRTHCSIEEATVGADRERHHRAAERYPAGRAKLAGGAEAVQRDIAVVGVRDVEGGRQTPHSSKKSGSASSN